MMDDEQKLHAARPTELVKCKCCSLEFSTDSDLTRRLSEPMTPKLITRLSTFYFATNLRV